MTDFQCNPRIKNLLGQRFGRLVVVEFLGVRPVGKTGSLAWWRCDCDCGNSHEFRSSHLTMGQVKSCGCITPRKHGMSAYGDYEKTHPSYTRWQNIIQRCENQNNPRFADYGGRGIKICDRWRKSFEAFINDMGHCPAPGMSIDRIDNNGHYEPGNCKWSTPKEQQLNRRCNRKRGAG